MPIEIEDEIPLTPAEQNMEIAKQAYRKEFEAELGDSFSLDTSNKTPVIEGTFSPTDNGSGFLTGAREITAKFSTQRAVLIGSAGSPRGSVFYIDLAADKFGMGPRENPSKDEEFLRGKPLEGPQQNLHVGLVKQLTTTLKDLQKNPASVDKRLI